MISMILYGRNDSYGYNLHKRAALSLNCMAEVLGGEDDEILFVDYNTPDDYPTFPEAIRDTLTAKARRLIRIFRVRPAQHARFRQQTHLAALEPVARNVALRRSNPGNRWILSTNTDMIFVPRDGCCSLSAIVHDLNDALYHIPRFEIPETLWEGLDRMDPEATISEIGRWGWELHLNEIVLGSDTILYDAPGDFQLAPRADFFGIDGFDERMLLGWHVDSNLARRLGFLHGPPLSLAAHVFGYHCDHTRQVTPMHRHDRIANDAVRWVDGVDAAPVPEQREIWGLAGEEVEEIRLAHGSGRYVSALLSGVGEAMGEPSEVAYVAATYDQMGYDPRHVVPYLVDALSCYPRTTRIGWIGVEADLLARFGAAWRALGFAGDLNIPDQAHWLTAAISGVHRRAAFAELADESDVFVIDFGPRPNGPDTADDSATHILRLVNFWCRELIMHERRRLESAKAPRRFIVVNAVHGQFDAFVSAHIGAPLAPIATRLRQGFVLPASKEIRPLLPLLLVGNAGLKEGSGIAALRSKEDFVFFGGALDLLEGAYRVSVSFEPQTLPRALAGLDLMRLEVVTGGHYLAFRALAAADLAHGSVTLAFAVTEEVLFYLAPLRIEIRLFTHGLAGARITDVTLEPMDTAPNQSLAGFDWLPMMSLGPAGEPAPVRSPWWRPNRRAPRTHQPDGTRQATSGGVIARRGEGGFVVYGPYVSLLPGRYLLEFDLAPTPDDNGRDQPEAGQISFDVYCLAEDAFLAKHSLPARALIEGSERIEFSVPDRPNLASKPVPLEFRVWSPGAIGFMVRAIRTRPIALLPIGEARADPDAVLPPAAARLAEAEERR